MSIGFSCSSCGQSFRVTDDMAGRKGRCPKCGNIYVIPKQSDVRPVASSIHLQPLEPSESQREPEPAPPPRVLAPPPMPAEKPSVYNMLFNPKAYNEAKEKAEVDARVSSNPYGPRRKKKRKRDHLLLLIGVLVVVGAAAAYLYRDWLQQHISPSELKEEIKELPAKVLGEKEKP